MGFTAVTEYAVPGGRLDVVWLWEPRMLIPGVVGAIPLAGFEPPGARPTRTTPRTLRVQELTWPSDSYLRDLRPGGAATAAATSARASAMRPGGRPSPRRRCW
jgi:hypothetical protein